MTVAPDALEEEPMSEQRGQKIRVVLRAIQILDDMEPFFKQRGEFRFNARIHSENNEGILVETRFPESGVWRISDKPGHNRVPLDLTIFEGYIEDHLAIELAGTEVDKLKADDQLETYKRVFSGPPETWIGTYGPGDEEIDPEHVGNWRVWYEIEKAQS